MIDDLLSLQVVMVSGLQRGRDLLRQAASAAKIPIEIVEANDADAACRSLADGADIVFLDAALPGEAMAQITMAARAAARPAFTVLLADARATPFETDALAPRPTRLDDAERLMTGAMRMRVASHVLIVDDSATMRAIVRKILVATRFPFEVTEVEEGIKAIELARKVDFDIVFLDCNMPGLSGLETMAEFHRAKQGPSFVLMTSAPDAAVADRAQAQGAAFLRKPFFPADIEALLCRFYGLYALNPKRA